MPLSRLWTPLGVLMLVLSADAARADDPVHLEWWILMKTPGNVLYSPEIPPPPAPSSQSSPAPSPLPVQIPASGFLRTDSLRPPLVPSPTPVQLCPSVTYTVVTPVPAQPSCQVRVVQKNNKAYLEIQTGADATLTCECMTMTIECNREKGTVKVPLKITVADNQVRIESECLRATADRLTHSGPGGCVTLAGGVKLKYDEGSRHAQIVADEIAVDLVDGRVEMRPARADREQVFSIVPGFFR